MDLRLPNSEPISDFGSISVLTSLRKGKKSCTVVRGVRKCKRSYSADTKVSEEGGG